MYNTGNGYGCVSVSVVKPFIPCYHFIHGYVLVIIIVIIIIVDAGAGVDVTGLLYFRSFFSVIFSAAVS